jgi:peptidoglycan/xylan/chitin deacetylase (PgdA/CDA1 family)
VLPATPWVRTPDVPRLALTFDDGPDRRWTPAVVAALRAADATATFFVLGECARRRPDVVRGVVAAGHAVEVHAHRHTSHADMTREDGAADLDRVLDVLDGLGIEPSRWRTPWGIEADWTRGLAAERGLDLVGWTADTHDWRGDPAGDMVTAVLPDLRDGAIVLAHDGLGPGALRTGCEETVALVAPLVAVARELGLEPGALG